MVVFSLVFRGHFPVLKSPKSTEEKVREAEEVRESPLSVFFFSRSLSRISPDISQILPSTQDQRIYEINSKANGEVLSMQVHGAKTYKESPRVSLSCGVPFLLRDQISRKSVSYNKLPQEPIKLTVLKLDATCFEIYVARNGTVVELKKAVESAFSDLPKNGPGTVSWSHVWGKFCLSYDGRKLLCDSDSIGYYGIKDGDQLEFVRHVSISYPVKARPEREGTYLAEPRDSKDNGDRRPECKQENNHPGKPEYHRIDNEEDNNVSVASNYECGSVHFLRKWFSYRRFSRSETRKG